MFCSQFAFYVNTLIGTLIKLNSYILILYFRLQVNWFVFMFFLFPAPWAPSRVDMCALQIFIIIILFATKILCWKTSCKMLDTPINALFWILHIKALLRLKTHLVSKSRAFYAPRLYALEGLYHQKLFPGQVKVCYINWLHPMDYQISPGSNYMALLTRKMLLLKQKSMCLACEKGYQIVIFPNLV